MKSILIVRIGAMGDIIHALPGVAALRRRYPEAHITWVVEPKWIDLLRGSGLVNRIVEFHRHQPSTWLQTRAELCRERYDVAFDFQGSIKSALIARAAAPAKLIGFSSDIVREKPAAWLYSEVVATQAAHVVDQGLDLAAQSRDIEFPLPAGSPEGTLPNQPFVLASPFAGWVSKQWPLEHFEELAHLLRERLRMPLVLNGPPGGAPKVAGTLTHESGIPGLIHATRRAALVVGVDSGPLHLAAALGKSGAAIFGPTDPARNGPRGGDFHVFRQPGAPTTHKRGRAIHPAMRSIAPEAVFAALEARAACSV